MYPKPDWISVHDVVKRNDVEKLECLLFRGADVNVTNSELKTPLQQAVLLSNDQDARRKSIELLLAAGADVNAQDNQGKTVLHHLAENATSNYPPRWLLDLLFKFKADLNVKSNASETALHIAVDRDNLGLVWFLTSRGADLNVHNKIDEVIPLHNACFKGNEAIVKCMVYGGADLNAQDSNGRIPVMEYFDFLMKKRDLDDGNVGERALLKFLLDGSDLSINSTKGIRKGYDGFVRGLAPPFLWKIILEQIAKLRALDIPVHSTLLDAISKHPEYSDYYSYCTEELREAKLKKFKNSWVSVFNLLVDSERKVKNYAGNQELVGSFNRGGYLKEFYVYRDEMLQKMQAGVITRFLYDRAAEKLSRCLPIFDPTQLIIRDTLDRLKFEDYRIFIV